MSLRITEDDNNLKPSECRETDQNEMLSDVDDSDFSVDESETEFNTEEANEDTGSDDQELSVEEMLQDVNDYPNALHDEVLNDKIESDTENAEDTESDTENTEDVEDTESAPKNAEDNESDTENVEDAEETTETDDQNDAVDNYSENGEATETKQDDSDSESNNEANDTASETSGESGTEQAETSEKTKLEDISVSEAMEMMQTPEGKAKLESMTADFREEYEADMRGMSVEEYRDYKAARARAEYEKAKENGEIEPRTPSETENKAEAALERFDALDEKSISAYMSGAKSQTLNDISDQNTQCIKDLKDIRQDVQTERDETWNKIASMNYDGTMDTNPAEYDKLCSQYRDLESLSDKLDYAIVKTDMNNWDISNVAGTEYHNEGIKKLDGKEVDSSFSEARFILREGVSDNASIMDAYKVGEKLDHDVLPSLDVDRREVDSRLTMADGSQESYLREHHCTHDEAMKYPDGSYARNEKYRESLRNEKAAIEDKMTEAVELSTALHDQVPMMGEDCTLKVVDNHNGTVTIERSWDNGGANTRSHEGRIHNSETTTYHNAIERKDSLTLGQNSGSVYAHSFSFQYIGVGFKREDTWGSENNKFKNVAEGGFLNLNTSFGYKRGTEGKMSSLTADASGSVAQLKDTASLVVKDKEYKGFSAEVSLLKESASVKADANGVSASASSHILGGEAKASVGGITVGKISGGIGEAKASFSVSSTELSASASMGDYKSSVSTWDAFKPAKENTDNGGDKKLIDAKASASIGNGTTFGSIKVSGDGEVKTSTVVDQVKKDATAFADGLKTGNLYINGDTVKGIQKDIKAVQDIKDGKVGTDVSKKPEDVVLGNAKVSEVSERPADFEAKDSNHGNETSESESKLEVSQELKDSLESFSQDKWDGLSTDERKEAIGNLADSVANELGLEKKPNVRYYQSDRIGDYGGYSASENAIYINENSIDDAKETVDTIAHESRHCWQHEYAEKSDSPQAQEFRENFEDYIRPEDDYLEYRNQPVEKDAREYASAITESIVPDKLSEVTDIHSETASAEGPNYKSLNEEKGAVFDTLNLPNDLNNKVDEKIPVSDAVRKSLEGSGLTDEKIKEIRDLPKPDYGNGGKIDRDINKPDPKTYLNPDYIAKHLESFEQTGCYRISRTDPMAPDDRFGGTLGHESGLFVTSGKDMMNALKEANGDVRKLESIFGMDKGSWGNNPCIIKISDPQNLRIPDGNEMGAWPKYYIPGGFTSGNQAEAVIDSVSRGEYQVMRLKDANLMDWMKKGMNN